MTARFPPGYVERSKIGWIRQIVPKSGRLKFLHGFSDWRMIRQRILSTRFLRLTKKAGHCRQVVLHFIEGERLPTSGPSTRSMSLPWGVRTLVFHQINPDIRSADMIDGGTAHRFKKAIPAP